MCSGMVQVLALQVQLAPVTLAHTTGKVEGRRAADVVTQQLMVLFLKIVTVQDGLISILQVVYALV